MRARLPVSNKIMDLVTLSFIRNQVNLNGNQKPFQIDSLHFIVEAIFNTIAPFSFNLVPHNFTNSNFSPH